MIIEYITAPVIYMVISWAIWAIQMSDMVPAMLAYKPWSCFKCSRFWLSLWVAGLAFIAGFAITAYSLAVIAVLDATALDWAERHNAENID